MNKIEEFRLAINHKDDIHVMSDHHLQLQSVDLSDGCSKTTKI